MTTSNIAETVESAIDSKGRKYYIPLKGPNAGIPTEEPTGNTVLADGNVISRKYHPEACSVLEHALGQQRFIVKKRGAVRRFLVDMWNDFITRNFSNHMWLMRLYRDCYKQNPDWHPECLILPDWRKDCMLTIMLKLATNTERKPKLEPRGMDFE